MKLKNFFFERFGSGGSIQEMKRKLTKERALQGENLDVLTGSEKFDGTLHRASGAPKREECRVKFRGCPGGCVHVAHAAATHRVISIHQCTGDLHLPPDQNPGRTRPPRSLPLLVAHCRYSDTQTRRRGKAGEGELDSS